MLTVIARIKVKPGAEQRFIDAAGPLIEATRAEAGCALYELSQSNETPGHFVFYEKWADQAALDRHMEMPHIKAFIDALGGDFDGAPVIELATTIA